MAKDLVELSKELVEKGYDFKKIYYSEAKDKFLETTSSNFSFNNITEVFAKHIKMGHNNFEVILNSEYKGAEKYYFVSLDSANKKIKLKEQHYNPNKDSYKGLIDIFKENEWKVDISDGK